jgi:hypothetical protein
LAAQVIAGGVVSTTVTVWLHNALFVQPSITRQVRVALYVLPHRAFVTVPTMVIATFVASHPSLAVGRVNVHPTPHSTTRLLAQVKTGGVLSMTVTVWLHNALFAQLSVARQVRVAL